MSNVGPLPLPVTHMVRDTCLCLHVQRAARALARRYDHALRPVRLTNGQFSLLMSLNRASPAAIGDVANLLDMDRTTLTASLKPLARRGLVEIEIDPADRRGRRLRLTPAGHRLLRRAMPLWEAAQQETARLLGESDPQKLRGALNRLSAGS
ncbi:MAG: winged helix-turn-helix transcriptional regulator [Alphaproteobacteria bacterium]|nr:winged helix-turn-helix transcriptional regulator [Alphaproteobacteria bacterium]